MDYRSTLPQTSDLDWQVGSIVNLTGAAPIDNNQLEVPYQDWPLASTAAPARAIKRKGKRCYRSRYPTSAGGPSTSDDSSDNLRKCSERFHCTVCTKSFKDMYGWKRHESGVHDFRLTEWTCMLNGVLLDGVDCAFCGEEVDDPTHFDRHSILNCLDKDATQKTFARKDLLKQHVQQVHLAMADEATKKAFQVPHCWAKDIDAAVSNPASLWCGFCQVSLESTALRMDHVVDHFRAGLDMSGWYPQSIAEGGSNW